MKKSFLVLSLLVGMAFGTHAQISKGRVMVSGSSDLSILFVDFNSLRSVAFILLLIMFE